AEYYEQQRKDLQAPAHVDTHNAEFIPGLGTTFQLNPSVQLFASVHEAFSPALNGDALDGLQNQKLEAERSVNIELGLRGKRERLQYEMAMFRMDFDNQIVPANSNTAFQNTNGGETLHQGMEAGVSYLFDTGFSVEANATYVPVAEFVGTRYEPNGVTVSTPDGNRVTYTPELVANLGLGYQVGNLKSLLSINYTDSQYTDVFNTGTIAENTTGFFTGEIDA